METSKNIVRSEFKARKENKKENLFKQIFENFETTVTFMVLGDKKILTFVVISFILYATFALIKMNYFK